MKMLKLLGHNTLEGHIYNLESIDGEFDLEVLDILDSDDCERVRSRLDLSDVSA